MEKTIKYLGKDVKIYQFYAESNNYLNARIDFLRKLEKKKINFAMLAQVLLT